MTTRKTFSLPDDLARALERAARSEDKPESAVVREALEPYLASRSASKLSLWVGKGKSDKPRRPGESYRDMLGEILEENYLKGRDEWLRERGDGVE